MMFFYTVPNGTEVSLLYFDSSDKKLCAFFETWRILLAFFNLLEYYKNCCLVCNSFTISCMHAKERAIMDTIDGVFYAKAAAYTGAAIAMGIGSIGPAIGQGLIGMKACENIGKYPENSKQIRNAMIVAMSLVETSAIYCALVAGALIWVSFLV
jgi:F-type H+-transporting ATPase subunit c